MRYGASAHCTRAYDDKCSFIVIFIVFSQLWEVFPRAFFVGIFRRNHPRGSGAFIIFRPSELQLVSTVCRGNFSINFFFNLEQKYGVRVIFGTCYRVHKILLLDSY